MEIDQAELQGQLRDCGWPTSSRQLDRLVDAGITARRQVALGRGRGSKTVYSADACSMVIAARSRLADTRDVEQVAWTMWREGFPVSHRCGRAPLERCARDYDRLARQLRPALERSREFSQTARSIFSFRTPDRFFRILRKAVGCERFPSFLQTVLQTAASRFQGFSAKPEQHDPDRTRDTRTLDAALGIKRARSDTIGGIGPIVTGEYDSTLRQLSDELGTGPIAERLAAISDEELQHAARELHTLFNVLSSAGMIVERAYGRGAFGMSRAAQFSAHAGLKLQVATTLLWAIYRRRPGVSGNVTSFLAATEQVIPMALRLRKNPDLVSAGKVRKLSSPWPHS